MEVWKFNRQVKEVSPGVTLRILADRSFVLHWCMGDWNRNIDTNSTATVIGLHHVDIAIPRGQTAPIKFTFRWLDEDRWEGKDFEVAMKRS
jgi:glucoamylase